MLATVLATVLAAAESVVQQPPPAPAPEPGPPGMIEPITPKALPGRAGELVRAIAGWIVTLAGIGAGGLFFLGVAWFFFGQATNHRNASAQAGAMIVTAIGAAALWGMGQGLIRMFATGPLG